MKDRTGKNPHLFFACPISYLYMDQNDSGIYEARIEAGCGDRVIFRREIRVAPFLNVDSPSKAQGLRDITFTASDLTSCGALEFMWIDGITGQTWNTQSITPNPSVSTAYSAVLIDTVSGDHANEDRSILVAVDPVYFDYNGDGCNTVVDLQAIIPTWGLFLTFTDPNGDGRMDIRDFLHINLDDSACP